MKVMITGGLGFIGSAVARYLYRNTLHQIMVLDAQTYAAQPEALEEALETDRVELELCDIRDLDRVTKCFAQFDPEIVLHLAAESHVDRSIDKPGGLPDLTGPTEMLGSTVGL